MIVEPYFGGACCASTWNTCQPAGIDMTEFEVWMDDHTSVFPNVGVTAFHIQKCMCRMNEMLIFNRETVCFFSSVQQQQQQIEKNARNANCYFRSESLVKSRRVA